MSVRVLQANDIRRFARVNRDLGAGHSSDAAGETSSKEVARASAASRLRLTEMRGAPASPGLATGPARILRERGDLARLLVGDIAICEFAAPTWTPLVAVAAGVITEAGGTLSSLAVLARENRLPAVAGVNDAMSLIRDGQVVTINGATGLISLER